VLLELTHQKLGWPSPEEIRNPDGAGVRIYADLAKLKLKKTIAHLEPNAGIEVGVLSRNPHSSQTEAPLAVVIEANSRISDSTLQEIHRLAWNFSHSPTVMTIEPGLLRAWTCCEPPDNARSIDAFLVEELSETDLSQGAIAADGAIQAFQWINMVSGKFFSDHAARFKRENRADQMLLSNLSYLRKSLRAAGLTDDDTCHDLIARIIFVQFLFHRKDANGTAALNVEKLRSLKKDGVLKYDHDGLSSILSYGNETYALFDWLNTKFNGDLFPGKSASSRERRFVKAAHLSLLKDFIDGEVDMPTGQISLWPMYAFDAIPLEFISSIYEAFVSEKASKDGIYYTPQHLVDFVLDKVLPWNSTDWNLKILDPACGSGVFLVKSFQRLVSRWKLANPGKSPNAPTLKSFLEKNLMGVDKDPHAVRVASFSMYLAMCDEIDPRHYWTQVVFPLCVIGELSNPISSMTASLDSVQLMMLMDMMSFLETPPGVTVSPRNRSQPNIGQRPINGR
jgi:hypothetical protein